MVFHLLILPCRPHPDRALCCLTEGDEKHFRNIFLDNGPDFHITRFIPASGAATRMFKSLFKAMEKLEGKRFGGTEAWMEENRRSGSFLRSWRSILFMRIWISSEGENPAEILKLMLGDKGLNYGEQTQRITEIP